MHLLYGLPAELQQAILAAALNMHMHRAPHHKLFVIRAFYFRHWCGDNIALDLESWLAKHLTSSNFEHIYRACNLDFMLCIKGHGSYSPCGDSGV